MQHPLLSCALLATVMACGTNAEPQPARAPQVELHALPGADAAPREPLSREVQQLLAARMQRHGAQMNALVSAVITLDWPTVQRTCDQLIEEPAIAPPLADEADSLNTQLPASFFVHQASLLAAVRTLRAAAEHKSDHASKVAFNAVVAACFDCHTAYLQEPARPDLLERAPDLR